MRRMQEGVATKRHGPLVRLPIALARRHLFEHAPRFHRFAFELCQKPSVMVIRLPPSGVRTERPECHMPAMTCRNESRPLPRRIHVTIPLHPAVLFKRESARLKQCVTATPGTMMRVNRKICAAALIALASIFSVGMLRAQAPVARRVMLDEAHHNIMATASGGYRP